jgi:Domain of unknown function (DUF5664)
VQLSQRTHAQKKPFVAQSVGVTSADNQRKKLMTQEAKDLHIPGSKDDEIRDFPEALLAVAHVATLGAKKYSESGWKDVPFARKRYLDAMMRHQLEIEMGNEIDQETKELHSAHVAWNALALAQIDAERTELDATAEPADREHKPEKPACVYESLKTPMFFELKGAASGT